VGAVGDRTAVFVGFMVAILALCGGLAAWRVRRIMAQRTDAEQRAAAAFEEMQRATRQLRGTQEQDAADALLPPGERLMRRYAGRQRRATNEGGKGDA
jgi:hypothetical protein